MKKITLLVLVIMFLVAIPLQSQAWDPPGGWSSFSKALFSGKYPGMFSSLGVKGTTGGKTARVVEATTGALSGASGTITLGIPSGNRILGVQFRVDTLITSAVGVSWTAVYTNTPTTAICSGKAFTKNTKFNTIHPAYEIATGTVAITITPNAGTFTAGVIRAIVYYENLDSMSDL